MGVAHYTVSRSDVLGVPSDAPEDVSTSAFHQPGGWTVVIILHSLIAALCVNLIFISPGGWIDVTHSFTDDFQEVDDGTLHCPFLDVLLVQYLTLLMMAHKLYIGHGGRLNG